MSDPSTLPKNLPAPVDDGAADHLEGSEVPREVALLATAGSSHVNIGSLEGRTILYAYPLTGRPGHMHKLPPGWDMIPGARGCTPQSCGFRDHFAELQGLGAHRVFGLSTQSTKYQSEMAERLQLPFPVLSDEEMALTRALRLPTFEASGQTLLRRMTLVIDDGRITHVFYPVFPPDANAREVVEWLKHHPYEP